ncbi:TerC/Alx family metal homeostasis membrane protein [Microbacterium sp. ASV81]|uniref:TerC/Alx family metal homeostasis membrane protein n=1 Tax=Microbacterium capsulatum TaxID=3041921 RepID=A0ABU0XDH2_9MICO|nr:TerC/Alx family metal homeostasis membrane protein [Microbacterium sp. ASV81]MDQ4213164.1 TerC/Alx family metal homeostasis membrane protein [Microbacterium sp. ASV81]
MDVPVWFEIVSLAVLVLILIGDLLLVRLRPHIPSTKESTLWVVFYVVLALGFAGLLLLVGGADPAGQFLTGWALEYSLSIDNLFVFVLIMARFTVPRRLQQQVLMVGIIIALVLRGGFIVLGVTIIENFAPVFYLFGAFLIWTAIRQAMPEKEQEEDAAAKEGFAVRLVRRLVPVSDAFDEGRVRTVVDGRRIWTPMIVVFVTIGVTDLMFAIDSIPAIFSITQDGFLVFTANIFALMGLRQLYFLLGDLLDRLRYLHYGIAVILGFIGVKLVLHAMHRNTVPFINRGRPIEWAPDVPIWLSLAVIVVAMLGATTASLIASGREKRQQGITAG